MTDKELAELQNIRKLLMLLLCKTGATRNEIARALKVTKGRVSQILPTKMVKPAKVVCLMPEEQRQKRKRVINAE